MAAAEQIVEVLAVSPGIAIGRIMVFAGASRYTDVPERQITEAEIEGELARFKQAHDATREALHRLKEQITGKLESRDADIFDAHMLILDDQCLINDTIKIIRENHRSADFAFFRASERYAKAMEAIDDEYLRERAMDVRDVAARLLNLLYNTEEQNITGNMSDRRIIIANELTPSETALLNPDKVLGFAVETGSATSHTAILARSMKLPAVVGIPHDFLALSGDTKIIIDGYAGRVILHPSARTLEAYRLKAEEADKLYSRLLQDRALLAETRDGFLVQLGANLEKTDDLPSVDHFGAHGIGLFRTELTFLQNDKIPEEEVQFEIYKKILSSMDGKMVVIRTLDIGGDKLNTSAYRTVEQNPFLGLRGIRLCLRERQDLFRIQLRALLRAGIFGNLKIMLPMVNNVAEVVEVKKLIRELQIELAAEKKDFLSTVSLGAMIETPVAALSVEKFARAVDFLSIGTNDLVQYTMSIDRSNEKVAYLYQPSHPAILELLARTVRAAKANNIWVGVCGAMAAAPQYTPLLLGLGFHELSMEPSSISVIRRVIRSLKMSEAEAMTRRAMQCDTAAETLALSLDLMRRSAPEIASLIMQQQN